MKSRLMIFILLISTVSCVIKPLNKKHYHTQKYYHKTLDTLISKIPKRAKYLDTTCFLGWGKINITPSHTKPMAGYGGRKNKYFDTVLDSIFIKAIVVKQGTRKSAIVCTDLLIFPMEVRKSLEMKLSTIGYSPQELFLTATHTHNSLGGWGKRLLGRAIAGKYEPKIVESMADAVVNAIAKADSTAEIGCVAYSEFATTNLIYNRLNEEDKNIDTTLRMITFVKTASRKRALLLTFAAHATSIASSARILSGDYPAYLTSYIENNKQVELATFAAGGVASHGPLQSNEPEPHKKILAYVNNIVGQMPIISYDKPHPNNTNLTAYHSPLYLKKPQYRISNNWVLSPWLFYAFFGNYKAELSVFAVGNILMVGTPCDFSGQLVLPLVAYAKQKGIHLIITSFNGGYIGYITPDEFYNKKAYETRDMNLFGPYNGAYISELIKIIIDHH